MKLNPSLYVRAAERIDSGASSLTCLAIRDQRGVDHTSPYEAMFGGYWTDKHPFWNKPATPERQQMRVLALLFMAAMVEAGDA
jgi:hypothetical protein